MKKIDKLILSSFLGPFFLTFLVVVFILLTQHMLKYFDDIVGKDLGMDVLAQLLFYFGVFMTPIAIPLAVLLSSLMTFGNLGEHFELTAIKSAGISLTRILLPIFSFVLIITVVAFYSNNYFVPKAALEAYSLLFDIKQKKPTLDLKEGAFYGGIPDFSIKVNKKLDDGKSLEDIIIYDHRDKNGNKKITLADSGTMYTVHHDRYLKLELFNGHNYSEGALADNQSRSRQEETMTRSQFSRSEMLMDLSSFDLDRTDKDLFKGNRIMRNLSELVTDMDSVDRKMMDRRVSAFNDLKFTTRYNFNNDGYILPKNLKTYKARKDSLAVIRITENKLNNDTTITSEQRALLKEKIVIAVAAGEFDNSSTSMYMGAYMNDNQDYLRDDELDQKIMMMKAELYNDPAFNDPNFSSIDSSVIDVPETPKVSSTIHNTKRTAGVRERVSKGRLKTLREEKTTTQPVRVDDADTLKMHEAHIASLMADEQNQRQAVEAALTSVRQLNSKIKASVSTLDQMRGDRIVYEIQWQKILANSVSCLVMFLIGAPLGAIIKRGGLGIPVLLSILFFIIFYVLTMTGEKWVKQEMVDPILGVWGANMLLFPIGIFFLRQARNDARLFDADFYNVMIEKLRRWVERMGLKVKS